MASRKTVTATNLAALGVKRLAAILVDLASGSAEIKRRLRLELAAEEGDDSIAAEIRKRLATIASAQSFVESHKRRDFLRDLDLQRSMIAERVAPARPDLALDLMWRFLDLAYSVIERADDSDGSIREIFQSACDDLGEIAVRAKPDPVSLAEGVCHAALTNEYGTFDGIVAITFPALGDAGVAHLKFLLSRALAQPPDPGRQDWRPPAARRALQDLADEEADVDAYIALVPAPHRNTPFIAAEIGRRLLAANRPAEALAALEQGRPKPRTAGAHDAELLFMVNRTVGAWPEVYIAALDASGRREEAQGLRWAAFEERLSVPDLRAYLKRLPDFDDVEAEDRAMAYALGFRIFPAALDFFLRWPDHIRAAQLVMARAKEIDGNTYYLLGPAAELLESRHPLAATLLLRPMIEDSLNGSKSSRYKHTARHMLECASIAPRIQDYGEVETHEAFVRRLRAKHGGKYGFWTLVPGT